MPRYRIPERTYGSPATVVDAFECTEPQIVALPAGDAKAQVGDWVVTHPDGKKELLTAEEFAVSGLELVPDAEFGDEPASGAAEGKADGDEA